MNNQIILSLFQNVLTCLGPAAFSSYPLKEQTVKYAAGRLEKEVWIEERKLLLLPCQCHVDKFQNSCLMILYINTTDMHLGIPLQCFFWGILADKHRFRGHFHSEYSWRQLNTKMLKSFRRRRGDWEKKMTCALLFSVEATFFETRKVYHQQLRCSTTFICLPCFLGVIYSV